MNLSVLHISTIKEWRGGDAQMLAIYSLIKEEVNQHILCVKNSVLEDKCKSQKITHFTSNRNGNFDLRFVFKLIRIVKSNKYNVIHTHDSTALTLTIIASYFLPNSIKIIYSRKRNNPIKQKKINSWKYNHSRITNIICVSHAVQNIFKPILKNLNKTVVIYDGINTTKFYKKPKTWFIHKEFNLPKNTIIVGNIAGLTRQKDIFTFINAAKQTLNKQTNLFFIVIGEGNLREELETEILKLKLDEKIKLLGFKTNIADYLNEFDVMLLSSETEGLPLSIYEAMANKTPIVTTNAGGIAEVIVNDKTGWVSPIKNATKLSDNLIDSLQNLNKTHKIVEEAFAYVNSNFTLQNMKENYLHFYKNI